MEEVKKSSPRSFRLDEETNQRVKSIMEQHKYSHQELFDVLLQSYVESNIKDSLGDRQKEIDNFETYISMIKSLYLTSLNDNKNVTEKVKNEFQDLLSSKDMLLIELQDKLKQYQGRMELAESESKKFKEEVEKNSNGRYVVDIYWYSSYASDAESFQMIQDGETDFNFGAGMSNVDKRFAWQRIPFLLPDLDTVREKLANPNAEGFAINTKLYEENGIKLLAQNSGLQRHIFSTDKLIKVPKDLANETFRTYEDAIVNEFYGGLGNIAIMPYGELYTSLQNGLITATDQQIPSYIIENYYEVAPFYSYVGAQWTSYSLMMNLDKFNQYSEEDQKIFVDAAWACSEAEYESYKDMKADAEKFFDEKGITYYQPTDEELNQWKEYAASLSDKWRELIGEELYNQVSELFNY